jgi:NitT/TauT family transport system permease protein
MERIERIERIEPASVIARNQAIPRATILTAIAKQTFIVILVVTLVLLVWELVARSQNVPTFFLPKPSDVAQRFAAAAADGILTRHLVYTWSEALVAFAMAFLLSTTLGYVLAKSPLLEKVVSPFIVASQSLPIFAIAPFVLIVFGNGFWSNAMMGALVAFFPMLVNNIAALRNVSDEQREVLQSFAATTRQVFAKLEVPATLPYVFGGMRVGITLAVIGVLVVELFWADRGIGFLLNFARGQFDTPLLFAGILALILMNLTMYALLALLQRIVMPWRYNPR